MNKNKETLFDKLKKEEEQKHLIEEAEESRSLKFKIGILFVSILICTTFFVLQFRDNNTDSTEYSLEPGYIWSSNTLIADVSFPIYKNNTTYESEVRKAENKALPVFIQKKDDLPTIENELEKITNPSKRDASTNLIPNSIFELCDKLTNFEGQDQRNKIKNELSYYIKNALSAGLIDIEKENVKSNEVIILSSQNTLEYRKTQNLTDTKEFLEKGKAYLDTKLKDKPNQVAKEILYIFKNANLVFSKDQTEVQKEMEKYNVAKTLGVIKKGEVIIKRGERVSENDALKLNSYLSAKYQLSEKNHIFFTIIGSFGHVCLIFSFIVIYLVKIRKKIFNDNFQFSLICGMMVITSLLSWITVEFKTEFPFEYLIFLPSLSMLAAIVFDSRTGFYATVAMALLIAGIRGNDYTTAVIMMFSGTLAAYTVRDIQNRTQMFRSIFFIFIGFLLPLISFGLERNADWILVAQKITISLVNSIVSPLITFGLLVIIDRTTNFATDLRLLEFDNLNHPLLLKLNEVAPGTYQHSMSLAMLSERCAAAINANQTFVKVASYFHDIGKMERPEYFAENQIYFGINKHDMISAKKSANVIIEHVANGVTLAREYKLPERLIEIIKNHHGNSLVRHFYAKALEQANANGEEISEKDFRYPGPKPNSKEAAIIMICDTAEAISRLGKKSLEELDELVDKIIREKFQDGQFDECNISTRELQIVQQTLVKNLTGLQHQRVEYKEIPTDKIEESNGN